MPSPSSLLVLQGEEIKGESEGVELHFGGNHGVVGEGQVRQMPNGSDG